MGEENIKRERAVLNTTIDKDVLDGFRESTKRMGMTMGIAVETFMRQFNNGEFTMTFKKNKAVLDLED